MQHLFTVLLGPMFAKEMIEISRRRRYFFNRVLYGSVLLAAVFVVWESNWYRWYQGVTMQAAAAIAAELFVAIACVQYGAVFVFVPVFVAGVIASERETNSLDLLLTTQLRDREIVVGKFGSRLAVVGLLVLCTLPVQSLIGLFGGVDPGAVLRTTCATILAMLYCGAHAIYFSTTTRSQMGALVRTYWWMALWMLALPMIVGFVSFGVLRLNSTYERVILPALVAINPGGSFFVSVVPMAHRDLTQWLGPWYFPAMLLVPAVWSLLLIWQAVRRLRQTPSGTLSWLAGLKRIVWAAPEYSFSSAERTAYETRQGELRARRANHWFGSRPIENPFWLRARLAKVYDRDGHIGRIQRGGWLLTGVFLLLCAVASHNPWNDDDLAAVFLSPIWIGVGVITAIVAASGLVSDRRRGFFDLVLVTDLSPWEIVAGTLAAVWEHLRPIYFLAWAVSAFFAIIGTTTPQGMFFSVLTGTFNCWLLLVIGTLCSLAARTVAEALIVTFAFPMVMIAGVPMFSIFRYEGAPVLWCCLAVLGVVAAVWLAWHVTTASMGMMLLAIHLLLVSLATGWTYSIRRGPDDALLMMNPAVMTVISLFRHDLDRMPELRLVYPLYWCALAATGALATWWMVCRFDTLVDRNLAKSDSLRRTNKLVPSAQTAE